MLFIAIRTHLVAVSACLSLRHKSQSTLSASVDKVLVFVIHLCVVLHRTPENKHLPAMRF